MCFSISALRLDRACSQCSRQAKVRQPSASAAAASLSLCRWRRPRSGSFSRMDIFQSLSDLPSIASLSRMEGMFAGALLERDVALSGV